MSSQDPHSPTPPSDRVEKGDQALARGIGEHQSNDLSADEGIHPDDVASIRKSLVFYQVMAWIVGVLLVVLVCVGMPLKYIWHNDAVVTYTGVPHGWLYMILIISAFNVGRRVQWSWGRLIGIALAGTVPFLSFVAERYATKDVRQKLDQVREDA